MKHRRRDYSHQSDAYGSRWYFAPVSVVVVGMAALQFIAELAPSPGQAVVASTPARPAGAGASVPSKAKPAESPTEAARILPRLAGQES